MSRDLILKRADFSAKHRFPLLLGKPRIGALMRVSAIFVA
jgi:hypothetical protein